MLPSSTTAVLSGERQPIASIHDLRAANVIGFLAGILLKALDSGRVEERLAHLEAVMTGKSGTDLELFDFKSAKESKHEEQ